MTVNASLLADEGIAYAGGRFVRLDEAVIPIEDRAHQFGDGVYEVIRVYHGHPFLLDEHLERFERSAKWVSIPLERSLDDLRTLIEEAIKRSGLQEAQVYFQLSRGIAKRNHAFPQMTLPHLTLTVRPLQDNLFIDRRERGLRVMLAEDIRWKLCAIKSLNLLPNILTKQKSLEAGYDDALFIRDDIITEGTSSNVAIILNGELMTHPANEQILHGITRKTLLVLAQTLGIPVREQGFGVKELMRAEEIFVMSTLLEIAPIVELEGHAVGVQALAPDSMVRALQKSYRELIERSCGI